MASPPRSDVRITVFHLSEEGDRDSEGGGKEPAAHTSGAFQSVHTAQATQSGRSALQGASKRRERDCALESDPLLNRERDPPLSQTQTQFRNPNRNLSQSHSQNRSQSPNQYQNQYQSHNQSQDRSQYQSQYQYQYPNRDRRRDREPSRRGMINRGVGRQFGRRCVVSRERERGRAADSALRSLRYAFAIAFTPVGGSEGEKDGEERCGDRWKRRLAVDLAIHVASKAFFLGGRVEFLVENHATR